MNAVSDQGNLRIVLDESVLRINSAKFLHF